MPTAADELAALLSSLFEPGELREWLHHREGFEFFLNLPPDDAAVAGAAAASLERHARLSADFFHALLRTRPHRVGPIARVAALCGVAPDPAELEGARARAAAAAPDPVFADSATRGPAERLDALYREREELVVAAQSTAEIDAKILELRRELRHGPRLHPGEFLDGGRYRLLEQVGQGGFGAVWRAYDRQARALVAIKVLHGHWSGERERRERFFRGARRMAELNHPCVVRVLRDRLEDQGFHAFVMELVSGGDLHGAVCGGQLDAAKALGVVLQVGAALAYAHERGLVHRDVKPHNVLLDEAGQPKLCDFDLVKDLDYSGSHTGGAMGTWVYASPELRRDAKHAGPRADVYGLGMTAAFCVYRADLPHEAVYDPVDFVGHLAASPALRGVLARAVQPEESRRFASMNELCEALRLALSAPEPAPDRPAQADALEQLLREGGDAAQITRLSAALVPGLTVQPGEVVAGAVLQERIGEGARSVVWRAARLDGGPAAVRIFRPEQLTAAGASEGFRRGLRALAALEGRSGDRWLFPEVYAISEDGLAASMALLRPGDPGEPLERLQAVVQALNAVDPEVAGLCDLRPHKLLADPRGRVALADLDPPPGEGSGEAAAVLRVGQLARALLLGDAAANDPWLDGLAEHPAALQELVWACLREDPAGRPSLAEVGRRLRDVALAGAPPPRPDPAPPNAPWRSWAAAAVALLAVSAAGLWVYGPDSAVEEDPAARYLTLSRDLGELDRQRLAEAERREDLTERLDRLEEHVGALNAVVASADPAEAAPLEGVLAQRSGELDALREEVRTLNAALEAQELTLARVEVEAQSARTDAIAAGAAPESLPPVARKPPKEHPALSRGEGVTSALKPAPMVFFEVEGGAFEMGSGAADAPAHRVILSGYRVSEQPVTRQQWELVLGPRGRPVVPDPGLPKTGMSWCDAVRFANRLSIRERVQPAYDNVPEQGCEHPEQIRWNRSSPGYRLPTEAEWEAASAWFEPAGPEWVWDTYDADYYRLSPPRDPRGPAPGAERVLRGGAKREHAPPDQPPPGVMVRLVVSG